MIRSWQADTLDIEVSVTFEVGAPISSLAGGSAVALAEKDGTVVTGTATIEDADTIRVRFAAGSLSVGFWKMQVRVTVSSVILTIADKQVSILESL